MEEQKTNANVAAGIRLIGSLVLIGGIVLLIMSQLMEISIKSGTFDPQELLDLQKQIATKTNYTILGGFLTVVGIQLCLVSTKLVSEINEQFKRHV